MTQTKIALYFVPGPQMVRLRKLLDELFELAETSGLSAERKAEAHKLLLEAREILEVEDE